MGDATSFYHLLSTAEAAEFLGLSTSALAKWRVYGAGPDYVKLGRRVAYTRAALEEFVRTRTRRSTSELRDQKNSRTPSESNNSEAVRSRS